MAGTETDRDYRDRLEREQQKIELDARIKDRSERGRDTTQREEREAPRVANIRRDTTQREEREAPRVVNLRRATTQREKREALRIANIEREALEERRAVIQRHKERFP